MSIGKRFTSFMLSAVMIAGNMVSPITAYAGETEAGNTGQVQSETAAETTSGQETATASEVQQAMNMPAPETEEKNYRLILPAGDGYSFTYDQNHFSEEDKEKKNVTLLYKAGDEVDLDLFAKDGYQLDKVSFTDKEKVDPQIDQLNVTYQEVSYSWKDEDTLVFTMPDKDIWMFTGNTYEIDLVEGGSKYTPFTDQILDKIDILVDGRFILEEKDIRLKFRGSRNQRIIDMKKSRETGKTILAADYN